MVRRRYYYRRTIRPKQKWAINTVDTPLFSGTSLSISSGESGSVGINVCTNSTRIGNNGSTSVSAAQVLKTGRWKYRGVILGPTSGVSYVFYLVYVPEGYFSSSDDFTISTSNTGLDIFYQHPEWVLAWTRKDYISSDQSNEVSLTSRLKRNLNTGDSIQMRVLIYNYSGSSLTIQANTQFVKGTVSYCCRAN